MEKSEMNNVFFAVRESIQNLKMHQRNSLKSDASPGFASTLRPMTRTHLGQRAWRSFARTWVSSPRTWWCWCWLTRWTPARWASSPSPSGRRDFLNFSATPLVNCNRSLNTSETSSTILKFSRGSIDTLMISLE